MSKKLSIISCFIIVFALFSSCQQEQITHLAIQGDWQSQVFKEHNSKRTYQFSFEEKSCSFLYNWGAFTSYEIRKDTLVIREPKRQSKSGKRRGGKKEYTFIIDEKSDSELLLIPVGEETKSIIRRGDFFSDTLKLTKLSAHKDVPFEKLAFYSSRCFGSCPSMYLEVDKAGQLLFEGKSYTDTIGCFSGQMSDDDFNIVQQKVNAVNWDNLKKRYSANHTDGQSLGIEITFENHIQKCKVYGNSDEPIAIQFLFHKLIDLYKNVNLEVDTVGRWRYENQAFIDFVFPPPPPPRPIK